MVEEIKKPTKVKITITKMYYDLELKRKVLVDETLRVSSTRAELLIKKGFAIKK